MKLLTKTFLLEHFGTFVAAAKAARERKKSKITAATLRNSSEILSAERSLLFKELIIEDCKNRLKFLNNEVEND